MLRTQPSGATQLPPRASRDYSANTGFANSGDRLYVEGMLHRRRKQELVRVLRMMATRQMMDGHHTNTG